MLDPFLAQTGFRFRNDDGDEASATWALDLNQQPLNPGTPGTEFRCRFAITEQNGETARNSAFSLLSRVNGGTWFPLSDAGAPLALYDSPNIVGTPDTTQQISSGGFTAGQMMDVNSSASDITIGGSDSTEYELCFELDDTKYGTIYNDDDTIDFVMAYADLTLLDDYTVMPTFTVAPVTQFSKLYLGGVKKDEFHINGNPVTQMFLGSTEVFRNQ